MSKRKAQSSSLFESALRSAALKVGADKTWRRASSSKALLTSRARTKNEAEGETCPLRYVDSLGWDVPNAVANADWVN